ncbi:MAG: NADH-quinone oxidoreductase subunit L [Caedimonas sp.]|nr:NADH-quinone oxidoreductase subunit L [Caedimonas sp.]
MVYITTIFAPLLGFLSAGTIGRNLPDRFSQMITCLLMGISVLGAGMIFNDVALGGTTVDIPLATWMEVDAFQVWWSLHFDTLSAIMIAVVTLVSFLVHIYSIGYMSQDPSIPRFMAYLSLFTFMMLMLVTAQDFLQLFFGWEGVGLASYLLIGFWYDRPSASAAALKAFIVNRIGDLGLVLGIGAIYVVFGTLEFKEIFALAPSRSGLGFSFWGYSFSCIEVICFLLFTGAMGKSAQIGLHVWLPDAMEGPTPVSALIHAATMVTAGVFLVVKCSPLYQYAPIASNIMTIVGATTAFFAGTIALTQNDIKRVIAYSTCSQLGYMFLAAGLSAYHIAIFHLVTHAFFKALLFLGAGAVIHSMSDEQDMQAMGGIGRLIPLTCLMMVVGSLALAGIPYFAGYYSKDAILETAWAVWAIESPGLTERSWVAAYGYASGLGGAFLTAFYSWRLLCLTFTGKPRADEMVMSHVHESGFVMLVPLFVLATGAIFSGYVGVGLFTSKIFWGGSLVMATEVSTHPEPAFIIQMLPALFALGGIVLAYALYVWNPSWPSLIAQKYRAIHQFLFHRWYVDELYDRILVSKALRLGAVFWRVGDGKIIDGWGPDGVAQLALRISNRSSRMQTGYLTHYAWAMVLGVALLIAWFMPVFKGVHNLEWRTSGASHTAQAARPADAAYKEGIYLSKTNGPDPVLTLTTTPPRHVLKGEGNKDQ